MFWLKFSVISSSQITFRDLRSIPIIRSTLRFEHQHHLLFHQSIIFSGEVFVPPQKDKRRESRLGPLDGSKGLGNPQIDDIIFNWIHERKKKSSIKIKLVDEEVFAMKIGLKRPRCPHRGYGSGGLWSLRADGRSSHCKALAIYSISPCKGSSSESQCCKRDPF